MRMSGSRAFYAGVAGLEGRHSLVAIFYAAHLLAAAALAAPMLQAIQAFSGHSLLSQDLLRGFSDLWAVDFKFWNAGFIEGFRQGVARAALIFLVFHTVLLGGAIETLRRPAREGLAAFGSGCLRMLAPFLRLLALSSVFYWLVFWMLYDLLGRAIARYEQQALNERGVVLASWAQLALLLAALCLLNLWLDYAKVALAASDRPSALQALRSGARCLRTRFGAALGAYLRWGIVGAVLVAAYLAASRFVPESNMLGVLLWFVLAQGFLWLRLRIRLGFYASAIAVFSTRSAPTPPRVGT